MNRIEQLIQHYKLEKHPEGGFYREVYRARLQVSAPWGTRAAATNIYFLLTAESFSAFHRIKADECWHFFEGDPLTIHCIGSGGAYQQIVLGERSGPDAVPDYQTLVTGGQWFASECSGPLGYALVGCTVAPGFHFADFELAERENLIKAFPAHDDIIRRLTR